MKLSTILKKEGLISATIHKHNHYTVIELFTKGCKKPKLTVYNVFNLDVNIPLISNETVKHLGINKYYHLVTNDYYINYYIY